MGQSYTSHVHARKNCTVSNVPSKTWGNKKTQKTIQDEIKTTSTNVYLFFDIEH